jgi:hypothetical protein
VADEVVVQLSGAQKREVEAALGRELTSFSASGDLFRIPRAVAEARADLPPSPPKAEDSQKAKDAARALPLEVDDLPESYVEHDGELEASANEDEDAVDVSGPSVQARH